MSNKITPPIIISLILIVVLLSACGRRPRPDPSFSDPNPPRRPTLKLEQGPGSDPPNNPTPIRLPTLQVPSHLPTPTPFWVGDFDVSLIDPQILGDIVADLNSRADHCVLLETGDSLCSGRTPGETLNNFADCNRGVLPNGVVIYICSD